MDKIILYIGNFRFPDKNAAGKRVLGNCMLLKSLGYKTVCIGHGDGTDVLAYGVLCHTIALGNIDRVLNSKVERILSILQKYRVENSVEAVILYGAIFTQKENVKIVKWCKKAGISVYYDHVDWFELNWRTPVRAIIRAYNQFVLDRCLIPGCDGVICASKYLAHNHEQNGKKTVVIPPLAVTMNDHQNTPREKNKLTFVYSGTSTDVARKPGQWKDRLDIMFEKLAEASEKTGTRPFQLDIYGLTRDQYIRMFPRNLRQSGLEQLERLRDRVAFYGHVSNALAMDAVANADFSILIRDRKRSTMAGFPTKVSESISCGTPVVCTDTSDLKDYIHNGKNGFVCEAESLADVFELVLKCSDDQLTDMKMNCDRRTFFYEGFQNRMKQFLEQGGSV